MDGAPAGVESLWPSVIRWKPVFNSQFIDFLRTVRTNGKNHPSNNPLMVVGSNVGSGSLNFFPHNQRITGSKSFKRRTRGFTKEPVKKRTSS
jgi:hypothetical protein